LASVGVVGYQGYIDAVKKDTTETNGRQIARAIEQDFLSLANGLKGTTELGTEMTVAGVKITSQVKAESSCYKYAENITQYLNERWKNPYDSGTPYAVNLHVLHSVAGASSSLKSGQIGMQCANVCEPPTGSFYLNNCSCAAGSDCTLYNFTKADFDTYDSDASCPGASCAYEEGDAPYDAYDYATSPKSASRTASGDEIWTGASGDAANTRYVLVGPHIPEWLCPKPATAMAANAVGCDCDNPSDPTYPCS
jgi:hypothetical protein